MTWLKSELPSLNHPVHRWICYNIAMSFASYLDPSFIDFEIIERTLKDIENLIPSRRVEVERDFKKWELENKVEKKVNEEWYQAMEDSFVDEMFFVSELERNLLNGLAVTLNTIFERHVSLFVREISKNVTSVTHNERCTYNMKVFKDILHKGNHPNFEKINTEMWKRLSMYTKIRNRIGHHEGYITEKGGIMDFVNSNMKLFVLDVNLQKITVKGEYIRKVLGDYKYFFRLLAYREDGSIIYT